MKRTIYQRALVSVVILASVALSACCGGTSVQTFYVAPTGDDTQKGSSSAPFATMERAREAVQQWRAENPDGGAVEVLFKGGIYPMSEPVIFTAEDSGTALAPTIYKAQSGAEVILSGGIAVSGWQQDENGIYFASLPEGLGEDYDLRQLYVSGERRQRARTPNEGLFTVADLIAPITDIRSQYNTRSSSFYYSEGDFDPTLIDKPTQAEVIVYHYWIDAHFPLESIDTDRKMITVQFPSKKQFCDGFDDPVNMGRYVLENYYGAIDQAGEWCFDQEAGKLFYLPMEGEDMQSVEVIIPRTTRLIELQANVEAGEAVSYLNFEGFQLSYTNFVLPEGDGNEGQGASTVEACVVLDGARHCSFTGCTLTNIGTFAFDLLSGCTDNTISHNTIEQVAAGGLRIKGAPAGSSPLLRTGDNKITDNTIGYYGLTYSSAVGILSQHTDGNEISHNHIHHGDYTGISLGWVWGYAPSASHHNIVSKNHIHHIGVNGLLSDMGAIYNLGRSPGTIISGNLIHDVDAVEYGGWGIYMDEGATSVLVEDNLVYNTKYGPFNIHYAKDILVRNNIFALGRLEQVSRERKEPHVSLYFQGNIVYWEQGELMAKDWSDREYNYYGGYFRAPRTDTHTTVLDWNLYYNPNTTLEDLRLSGMNWEQWRATGKDINSQYADPLFVDVKNHDFTLRSDSPALKMGFQPLDMSDVGPRN